MLTRFAGNGSAETMAREALALTKMDWNNDAFFDPMPVMIMYFKRLTQTISHVLAVDMIAWTRHLLLDGDLVKAEPKTLRYRLLHVAARSDTANAAAGYTFNGPGPGPPSWPQRSPDSPSCPPGPVEPSSQPRRATGATGRRARRQHRHAYHQEQHRRSTAALEDHFAPL
jgi:hypothetical protein